MIQAKVKIVSNSQVTPGHFKMILDSLEISREASPGQFIHVRVNEELDPLLRRPFSIHRARDGSIEILCKVRGKATDILSGRKSGEFLDVIGPLGEGFPLPEISREDGMSCAILVAGGFGVAPLVFLAERLRELKAKKPKIKIIALVGARTKKHILCEKDLINLCDEVKIATDDGSCGYKGLVTDLLKDLLADVNCQSSVLYASGPNFMLQEIKEIVKIFKILSFGSLEENIACGLGGCFGCVVKTIEGYKRVCKDGPVFNLKEIVWD
ncbi:MAG: dihydroorotate dehydrogenase electron transfer subunit [Candidatus Omnitrophica bacterium]|nr:dihydroorotate dehydrogenase electron transfer subunit [Candidatus Omnitrophota bacterium]